MIKKLLLIIITILFVFLTVNTVSATSVTQQITVWQDNRDGSNWHIYYKKLDNGQTGRVTGISSNQTNPAISGNTVVWQDNRDGTNHIYYKNLDNGQTGRVTGVNSNQTNPAISGNTVVWSDNRNGGSHIYYKKLDNGQTGRVTGYNSNQVIPAISGNTVVWQDNREGTNHIYYKNLNTGQTGRVTGYNSQQWNAAISGNTVVWEDDRNKQSHIYYKNLGTGQNGRVTGYNSIQLSPDISGSIVTWEDYREGPSHIYYKNLFTGTCGRVTGYSSYQLYPVVSENIIVWQDNRDGSNWHIYYKKLDTGQTGRLTGYNSNQYIVLDDLNTNPPSTSAKLVFIHHSTGENWLSDYNGGLGLVLQNNNYYVSDTNYGWGPDSIGDRTDIGNWWEWFRGSDSETYLNALYNENGQNCDYSRLSTDPGGENQIVMFKSCFPNSALKGNPNDPVPPINSNPLRGESCGSEYHTVANAKGIYIDILEYFKTRPDKLFIIITAPPLSDATYANNARAFNNWMVNDWLKNYPYKNVFVFDFYNVLTSNGGSPDINDLEQVNGNHHRFIDGSINHSTNTQNTTAYPSGDDHPSQAGNLKATGEFMTLLNIAYNNWKGL